MTDSQFYLYFDEGYYEEEPRLCTRVREVLFGTKGSLGLLVGIDPPCSGTRYIPSGADIHYLLLDRYFVGQSFSPVPRWPMPVHVYVPLVENPELCDHIRANEVRNIALGSIYKTIKPESPILPDVSVAGGERIDRLNLFPTTFIGDQDGPVERELKKKLIPCLSPYKQVTKAFLARVAYGSSTVQQVALCLVGGARDAEQILGCVQPIFEQMFSASDSLDIVFLTEGKLKQISAVAKPFYDNTGG